MTSSTQQFCLRWNNHMSNFATAVAQLLRSEAFTDVTIAVDEGTTIKCHKMVLAACSSYFQEVFIKNPCEHPIIILSDVKFVEIQAILDYMYRGEVNVAQDQLNGLLRVAGFLKVKGLVQDDTESNVKPEPMDAPYSPLSELAHASAAAAAVQAAEAAVHAAATAATGALSNGYTSPLPHVATPFGMPFPKSPNAMALWPALAGLQMPQNPIGGHQPPSCRTSFLGGSYESTNDISPLSRKKLSSYMAHRDTPILRNVLGGQNDSSTSDRNDTPTTNSNGSAQDSERRNSTEQTEPMAEEEAKPPTTPHKNGTHRDPNKEWKRYKQYTAADIRAAMEAVRRKEMSALQAAAKYGIPSRTLYDKLKKAGILPARGIGAHRAPRESLHTSSARFPYSSSMNGSVYGGGASVSNGVSESESDNGNGYASETHEASTRETPPIPLLNGLSLTPNSRRDSLDEMDLGVSNNNAGTSSSNEDGAEDLSVGSRRSSDNSVIVPPAALDIKEEDETSMHHDES